MAPNTVARAQSLQPYPNITKAAEILGVDPSTLSRRADLQSEPRGARDRVLPAREVLRLAVVFRKRSLNDVAQALLDHARSAAPEELTRVQEEIETFFEERTGEPALAREEFLRMAARLLPPELFRQVEACLETDPRSAPSTIVGYGQ